MQAAACCNLRPVEVAAVEDRRPEPRVHRAESKPAPQPAPRAAHARRVRPAPAEADGVRGAVGDGEQRGHGLLVRHGWRSCWVHTRMGGGSQPWRLAWTHTRRPAPPALRARARTATCRGTGACALQPRRASRSPATCSRTGSRARSSSRATEAARPAATQRSARRCCTASRSGGSAGRGRPRYRRPDSSRRAAVKCGWAQAAPSERRVGIKVYGLGLTTDFWTRSLLSTERSDHSGTYA